LFPCTVFIAARVVPLLMDPAYLYLYLSASDEDSV